MRSDASLAFVPIGGNLNLAAGAGVATPSNVLDMLGQGQGTAPQNIIGNTTLFGTNPGVGRYKQRINIAIASTPAVATATAATLTIQLQMAPDTGSAGGYLPGTWQVIDQSPAFTAAQLLAAQTGALQQPLRMDWPANFPDNLDPRYARLLFTVPAATDFTALTIYSALLTPVDDDYAVKQQARNYTVS